MAGKYDKRARSMRKGVRPNYDEEGNRIGESTHVMRHELTDDGWAAFPSLFQDPDGTWVEDFENIEDDWFPVYKEALRRGEVFPFKTEKEAEGFAMGSWKPVEDKIINSFKELK